MDKESLKSKVQSLKYDFKKIFVYILLVFLIGFNFYLYRAEFKVLVDPNDNIFQYALIDEARNIWKQVFAGKLSPVYLFDSWQERWAEGFALSSYYAHLPQAAISLIGLIGQIGEFKLFVIVRTLMLIVMPMMFFWGGTILRLPAGASLIVSLLAQAINTDGLYGIDATSYLWRGWGLSAQLMAVFFLPVAFGYTIDFLKNGTDENNWTNWKKLVRAIFFNFLVASCHFGIFSLALMAYPILIIVHIFERSGFPRIDNGLPLIKKLWESNKEQILRGTWFISLILFSLSYFIIPFFLQSQYRNYSVWDPIWKFDSWGVKQIIIWLINGELFDFGRLPIVTAIVGFGVYEGFVGKNKLIRYMSLLFIFYFILFLGRATFGGIIDLIPGFSEFHQHRTVVLVQFIGVFIAGNFLYKLSRDLHGLLANVHGLKNQRKSVSHLWKSWLLIILTVIVLPTAYYLEGPLIKYAKDNAIWIERSNKAYFQDLPDYEKIKAKLNSLPRARIYAGKPGNWGKQFTVGELPVYMALSRDGYSTIGFLPESWSPNSDPEQFFSENDINFFNLYNVGYAIYPEKVQPPDLAKLIAKENKYSLYQIKTDGWFSVGTSSIAVKSKKTDLLTITRLWFDSDLFKNQDYPMIDLSKNPPDGKKWYIKMTDRNNWTNLNDGKARNLWKANPMSVNITNVARPSNIGNIRIEQQEELINGYKARVELTSDCQNCIVVLKQSYHPNWQVRMNGEKVKSFPVFPFYIGIPIEKAGSYEILAEYKPGSLKIFLVCIEIVVFGYFIVVFLRNRLRIN